LDLAIQRLIGPVEGSHGSGDPLWARVWARV